MTWLIAAFAAVVGVLVGALAMGVYTVVLADVWAGGAAEFDETGPSEVQL